jgi:hypothetical protein
VRQGKYGEIKNTYNISVCKPEQRRPPGRPWHIWKHMKKKKNNPGPKREMVDIKEGTVLQRDRCLNKNQDKTTTMPSQRL